MASGLSGCLPLGEGGRGFRSNVNGRRGLRLSSSAQRLQEAEGFGRARLCEAKSCMFSDVQSGSFCLSIRQPACPAGCRPLSRPSVHLSVRLICPWHRLVCRIYMVYII
jgi:hypothetical protein